MEALQKRYIEASKEYVEKEKLNEDVIGIIVTGSIIYSTIDKNSDIDIYVILDPKCDYRERGNLWINDIEIEYFKNPPAQTKSYFKKETESPITAHMFAYGELVFSKSEMVEELIATAKTIIKEKPPILKGFEIEFEKYFIDDYFKDFEDALINEDFLGANIIRHKIVNRCIDIFCKLHQVRRGKDKKLSKQMEQLDPIFNDGISLTLKEDWNVMTSIKKLRIATENLLGGARTKEWKLRSKLDL